MENKKVLVFLGNSDADSMTNALADSFEKGARDSGFAVKRVNIADLKFDPILHKGYKVIQELEPDLKKLQELFKWADHIAIFYPNWWGTMPALLKGVFDRMFLPGFAFKFEKGSWMWHKLLSGRSATVFITMNTHPWLAQILFGDNSNEIKRNILKFAGISPVRLVKVGPIERMSETKKESLKRFSYGLGRKSS